MFREIKGEMARHGMTANDLAAALGISTASFSLKMTGKRDWKLSEAFKIQALLAPDKTINELFRREAK